MHNIKYYSPLFFKRSVFIFEKNNKLITISYLLALVFFSHSVRQLYFKNKFANNDFFKLFNFSNFLFRRLARKEKKRKFACLDLYLQVDTKQRRGTFYDKAFKLITEFISELSSFHFLIGFL